jgi:hypothetical protein
MCCLKCFFLVLFFFIVCCSFVLQYVVCTIRDVHIATKWQYTHTHIYTYIYRHARLWSILTPQTSVIYLFVPYSSDTFKNVSLIPGPRQARNPRAESRFRKSGHLGCPGFSNVARNTGGQNYCRACCVQAHWLHAYIFHAYVIKHVRALSVYSWVDFVWVCVYVHVHVCTCMYTYVVKSVIPCAYVCMYVCMYEWMYATLCGTFMKTHERTCEQTHKRTCVEIHQRIYNADRLSKRILYVYNICVCMYVCMYVCVHSLQYIRNLLHTYIIYIYTHTHMCVHISLMYSMHWIHPTF